MSPALKERAALSWSLIKSLMAFACDPPIASAGWKQNTTESFDFVLHRKQPINWQFYYLEIFLNPLAFADDSYSYIGCDSACNARVPELDGIHKAPHDLW